MPNPEPIQTDVVEGGTDEQGGAPVSSGQVTATEQRGVSKLAPAPSQAVSEALHLMQVMERMARNKEVDTAKLSQVREFAQSILADQRRAAFDDALAQMQAELPTIGAKGRLEIRAKDPKTGERTGKVLQSTPYAKWEDINDAIKPILKTHGFGLRFKTGLSEKGLVTVTGILSGHGHREETMFELQHDSTGSKNAVQAVGSSTSYGKRYAACALLNITTRGEDDDGKKGGGAPIEESGFPGDAVITSDQITQLVDECKKRGCSRTKFLEWVSGWSDATEIDQIRATDFKACMEGLASFKKSK